MADSEISPLLASIVRSVLIGEFLLGITENILVLLVFYRRPGLLTIANRFVVNLTIINIIACVTLLPLTFLDTIQPFEREVFCPAANFFAFFISSLISTSVLLIAVDQYCAVVDPFNYHRKISNQRSRWMIFSMWILPLLTSLLGVSLLLISESDWSLFPLCRPINSIILIPWIGVPFAITHTFLFFLLPLIAICCIYLKICAEASHNTKRVMQHSKEDLQQQLDNLSDTSRKTDPLASPRPSFVLTRPSPPRSNTSSNSSMNIITEEMTIKTIESLPNLEKSECESLLKPPLKRNVSFSKMSTVDLVEFPIKPRSPSIQSETSSRSSSSVSRASSFLVNNLKHRISNASLFRYREEARAARISAVVFVMVLVCWLPFFLSLNLRAVSSIFNLEHHTSFHRISLTLLLASTAVSPGLFAFRTKKVRKEVRKLFRMRKNDLPKLKQVGIVLRLKNQAAKWMFDPKPSVMV